MCGRLDQGDLDPLDRRPARLASRIAVEPFAQIHLGDVVDGPPAASRTLPAGLAEAVGDHADAPVAQCWSTWFICDRTAALR